MMALACRVLLTLLTVSSTVPALLPGLAWAQSALVPVTLHSYDSEELVGEPGDAAHVLDGDEATIWFTAWKTTRARFPHWLILDLGGRYEVDGLRYLPRTDGVLFGMIAGYEIAVSDDPAQWPAPVARGTFPTSPQEQVVRFAATPGRYVRLLATSPIVTGHLAAGAAEVGVYALPRLTLAWDQEGTPLKFTLYRSLDGGDTYTEHAELPGTARTYDETDVPDDQSVCYVITNWHTDRTGRAVESLPNRWPVCLDAAAPPSCLAEEP